MTKFSQYLEPYLEGNARRIAEGDLPITIGTFINQQLTGRAKKYGVKYAQALKRSCVAVDAAEVMSKGGGRAYVRRQEPQAHFHTCQQCHQVVGEECFCEKGDTINVWCSPGCKAAFDL